MISITPVSEYVVSDIMWHLELLFILLKIMSLHLIDIITCIVNRQQLSV